MPRITNLLIRFRRMVSRSGRFTAVPIGQKAGCEMFRVYRVTPDTSIRPQLVCGKRNTDVAKMKRCYVPCVMLCKVM